MDEMKFLIEFLIGFGVGMSFVCAKLKKYGAAIFYAMATNALITLLLVRFF